MNPSLLVHRLFLIVFFIPIFQGCESETESVRVVANKYLKARMSGDFGSAENYVTMASQEQIDELAVLSVEYLEEDFRTLHYRILEIERDGKKAVVTYEIQGYGEAKLNLARESGDWRVVLSPMNVPDENMLFMELLELETQDTSDLGAEELDNLLLSEELDETWMDSIGRD